MKAKTESVQFHLFMQMDRKILRLQVKVYLMEMDICGDLLNVPR